MSMVAPMVARSALLVTVAFGPAVPIAPHWIRVDAAGDWTGYVASIQIEPPSDTIIWTWPGTFLADGTFVQNGIRQPDPNTGNVAEAFVWAQRTPGIPLALIPLPDAKAGDWYTFGLTRSGSRWTAWFTDPSGHRTVQGSFDDPVDIQSVQAIAEPWLPTWGPFPTQRIRSFRAKTPAGRWIVPSFVYTASAPQCGTVKLTSPAPGAFTFAWGGGPPAPACYRVMGR